MLHIVSHVAWAHGLGAILESSSVCVSHTHPVTEPHHSPLSCLYLLSLSSPIIKTLQQPPFVLRVKSRPGVKRCVTWPQPLLSSPILLRFCMLTPLLPHCVQFLEYWPNFLLPQDLCTHSCCCQGHCFLNLSMAPSFP